MELLAIIVLVVQSVLIVTSAVPPGSSNGSDAGAS